VVVALVESNGQLERAAAECGADRFRAHVTLARCRRRAALPDYGSVNVAFRLGSVGLYRSLAGARYTLVSPTGSGR
jgi:2'-5' RNA ligase